MAMLCISYHNRDIDGRHPRKHPRTPLQVVLSSLKPTEPLMGLMSSQSCFF